ncbi:hypothetical protein [Pseudobacteriovorax antillogorgiicola]|uniref:EF-hand domain-containing protein n=1 Tax=Pseudobacteriovorax antillogorgiicola TaxID=1513793 RepID=A0A1Y6CXB0_9BACT|nr:hypothetical protein [Pseudobacteriovorax antillogorgiicola]TCS41895.1 hypothetical protein EDD56_1459 [Pseudobacteriovorax antillogorgiicola]SMF83165.1 hypothetical protein SAMN06296036_1453 [Pseudobacteriovorax antillogorgiicola]
MIRMWLTLAALVISGSAFAWGKQNQNLESLAAALVYEDIRNGTLELQDDDSIFDQIGEFIEETKTFLLENFDYNGNGRIDFGPELNDALDTFKDIVVLLLDQNQNGTVEIEELKQAIDDLVTLVRDEITARACVGIITEAERVGFWIHFRPILKGLYQRCTAEP